MTPASEVEYYKRLVHSKDSVIFELRIIENGLRNSVQMRDFQVSFYQEQYKALQNKNKKSDIIHIVILVVATTAGYLISQNL